MILTFPSKRRASFTDHVEVATPLMVKARKAKDPKFFRFANHLVFGDGKGCYYVIITAHFPAVLKTNESKTCQHVATIRGRFNLREIRIRHQELFRKYQLNQICRSRIFNDRRLPFSNN